jgi:hypothetical protein
MNPPYNKPVHKKGRKGGYGGRTLWDKFLKTAIDDIVEDGGYLVSVNPSAWRKPESPRSQTLFKKLTHENNMTHLSIHSKKDGQETFGASTRYDYFCVHKSSEVGLTLVIDEERVESAIGLNDHLWLPNYFFGAFGDLLAAEEEKKCEVIFSASKYETRKKWVSTQQTDEYQYPVVHNMTLKGPGYVYSSSNDRGHFGIPKVILSFNEKQQCPINDYKGEFGMSQIAFGIPVQSKEDGDKLVSFINSDIGKAIVAASKWSTFQTDWRMFTYFKEGFWRDQS